MNKYIINFELPTTNQKKEIVVYASFMSYLWRQVSNNCCEYWLKSEKWVVSSENKMSYENFSSNLRKWSKKSKPNSAAVWCRLCSFRKIQWNYHQTRFSPSRRLALSLKMFTKHFFNPQPFYQWNCEAHHDFQ